MGEMKLKEVSHITIGDIVKFAPIMKLPLRDAKGLIAEFKQQHNLNEEGIRTMCSITTCLGLYVY